MACYGIETRQIDELAALVRDVNERQLFGLAPDTPEDYSERHFEQNRRIFRAYIAAFEIFLRILAAVMRRKLDLLGVAAGEAEHHAYRYLGEFVPIYDRAAQRTQFMLERWTADPDVGQEYYTDFVREVIASGTAEEMYVYATHVDTASSLQEVESHGQTGHEVENSIKDFLRDKLPGGKRLKRGFQLLNEIISIIFPRGGM